MPVANGRRRGKVPTLDICQTDVKRITEIVIDGAKPAAHDK